MSMKTHITPRDLSILSDDAKAKLWSWWPLALADLYVDEETGDVNVAGDTGIYNCVAKDHGHYDSALPLLSVTQMIAYLDDHGLYRDDATGMTHADGIAADQLCAWLWSRTAAHLEHDEYPQPLPDFVAVVG
jgi:hypothetical protein